MTDEGGPFWPTPSEFEDKAPDTQPPADDVVEVAEPQLDVCEPDEAQPVLTEPDPEPELPIGLEPDPEYPTAASEAPRRDAKGLKIALVALALLVVAGGAYMLGQRGGTSTTKTTTTSTSFASLAASDLVSFNDKASGISLRYPKTWRRLTPSAGDSGVVLILSAGGEDSVLVRTTEMSAPVSKENLGDLKAVTDGIISEANVKLLKQASIEVNGMSGYYYLYLFNDPVTGQQGVHAHYFLFRGRSMNSMVFQAVPTGQFDALAPAFDSIASSFKSSAPLEAPTTTAQR